MLGRSRGGQLREASLITARRPAVQLGKPGHGWCRVNGTDPDDVRDGTEEFTLAWGGL
jgi:hypothetical protein